MFFQKKTAVAAVVAHIFNPSDGILSTSPDTKPKIEFLQSSEELREIHFVSRNNLVEIEKGLASNPHCNVFGAGAVGGLKNPGAKIIKLNSLQSLEETTGDSFWKPQQPS